MTLKDDWVDENTPGKTAPDWTYTAAAANLVADAANLTTTKLAAVFHVDVYGADPTGVAASDTAVAAAITAMGTDPGILEFGCGTYKLASTKTLANPGQGIRGQGVGATTILFTGTGDCLRVYDSTYSLGWAAPITGFTITATGNANTNICGLHIGDLIGINIWDVFIEDFATTGAKGFWGENIETWSERANIQMVVHSCVICFLFDTNASNSNQPGSWDYSTYNLAFSCDPDQSGIVLQNTMLVGVDMVAVGNCAPGASSNTGVVLTVGTDAEDASVFAGRLHLIAESNGPGGYVGHTDINVGAAAWLRGYGGIMLPDAATPWEAGTATRSNCQFFGVVDCSSLGHHADTCATATQPVSLPQIKDTNNNAILDLAPNADAVNYLQVYNTPSGWGQIGLNVQGTDTNIGFNFSPKGGGGFTLYENAAQTSGAFSVDGTATDIDLVFYTKGAGRVKDNGNIVGSWVGVPATATSTGKTGQMAADASYLYICYGTNLWGRVGIASW